MIRWLTGMFRPKPSWTYRILFFPGLGYLPVLKEYTGVYAIDRHGCSSVAAESAARWKDLFHETEAEAGAALNLHATLHDSNVVWEG